MPSVDATVTSVLRAQSWDARVAALRRVPEQHGTAEHQGIYAAIAKEAYVPHLAPDFAYVPVRDFYEPLHFLTAYHRAQELTRNFVDVDVDNLARVLGEHPTTLLVFRTITGLLSAEFAATTALVAEVLGGQGVSKGRIDNIERSGVAISAGQARLLAETIDRIMHGLYGAPPTGLKSKQDKPDTEGGWDSVRRLAAGGVPYELFLHQRHYGGSFRQLLDATSTQRGDVLEDAVEALFVEHNVPYVRTGAHNQAEIEHRFKLTVHPAPDFVMFDTSDALRGMLECKGANDGGTARDKALRYRTLRDEAVRLGGVPLFAVLAGLGWTRVNDALGPVVRDTDGRVFSLANLPEMMTVQPLPTLVGLAH